MQVLALARALEGLTSRLAMPRRVPPFNALGQRLFSVVWTLAFLLAVIGPAAGLYYRYATPSDNSQLVLGSRAGVAVSDHDATRIRFAVGPYAREAGIRPSDQIVAIYGIPLPERLAVTPQALASHADNPAYIMVTNLLFGTDSSAIPLTLRSPEGREREVTITTGEHHLEEAAGERGIPPNLLSFVDLLHVMFYPFLLWVSWILHRRNARDAVSSMLSLAILLNTAAEQPSWTFLAAQDVPRWVQVGLYDLGNILLLAGMLLFPHGDLSPRRIMLLALLPVLMLLRGDLYQSVLLLFMITAVLILVRCLRNTAPSDLHQQVKWALFGFSGYALFRGLSILGDMLKTSTDGLTLQLLVEIGAGLSLSLAVLLLQLGLLVALLRYRLYDAEAIISRTASITIVTLIIAATAAALMEGVITQMQEIYPGSETPAAMVGAVLATVLFVPLHGKVQSWAERRFHKKLLELKEGVPEAMRELREIVTLDDFIAEVLSRINAGLVASRSAFVLGREVKGALGVGQAEVLRWLLTFQPRPDCGSVHCDPEDRVFPLRLRVEGSGGAFSGWVLIGPRPDGSIAGTDEREALEQLAAPLARSLRIVLKREQEKQELLQLLEMHRQRIESIERRLQY